MLEHYTTDFGLSQADLSTLDLHRFLPLFFDGLRDSKDAYSFIAATVKK
jgi:hypothetical protein